MHVLTENHLFSSFDVFDAIQKTGLFFETANTIMEIFIHWLAYTFSGVYRLWTQMKKLAYITNNMPS